MASKTPPRHLQDASKSAQDAPKRPQETSRRLQDAFLSAQDASKSFRDVLTGPQVASKTIQDAPRHLQDASKTLPRPSKMLPNAYRTAPRRLQERRIRPQEASIRLQVDFLKNFPPASASQTTKIKPPLQRELHFSSPRCSVSYFFCIWIFTMITELGPIWMRIWFHSGIKHLLKSDQHRSRTLPRDA